MFWFKNKSRHDQNKALEKIESRLGQLEHVLQELINQGTNYEITIEELNIHDPYLDNLTFRLDKLDVKDLSGALNLGNNFGVNVHQGDKKKGQEKKTPSSGHDGAGRSTPNEPKVNIVHTKDRHSSSKGRHAQKMQAWMKENTKKPKPKGRTDEDVKVHLYPLNKSSGDTGFGVVSRS